MKGFIIYLGGKMEVDEYALAILLAYGFEEAISKRALLASENSVDGAFDWIAEYMDGV